MPITLLDPATPATPTTTQAKYDATNAQIDAAVQRAAVVLLASYKEIIRLIERNPYKLAKTDVRSNFVSAHGLTLADLDRVGILAKTVILLVQPTLANGQPTISDSLPTATVTLPGA